MELLHNSEMKNYQLYVFTQKGCAPCEKLAAHLATLSPEEQQEINVVPMRMETRTQRIPPRTDLAKQFKVMKSPTLVIAYPQVICAMAQGEDEWCEEFEVPVEKIEGAKAIIKALSHTLADYTYAHTE